MKIAQNVILLVSHVVILLKVIALIVTPLEYFIKEFVIKNLYVQAKLLKSFVIVLTVTLLVKSVLPDLTLLVQNVTRQKDYFIKINVF